jgi:hypothetical protein
MNFQQAYGTPLMTNNLQSGYNGRVNLITGESPDNKIKMMERSMKKHKATTYCDALNGVWERSVHSDLFFSAKNTQTIQNAIRAQVYAKSGNKFVLAQPDPDNLQIIMRSFFLQYAQFDPSRVTAELQMINDLVIEFCVHQLYGSAVSHIRYLEDQSSLVQPLERPLNHDRNYKELELKAWV